jgi:hypothetical protein
MFPVVLFFFNSLGSHTPLSSQNKISASTFFYLLSICVSVFFILCIN